MLAFFFLTGFLFRVWLGHTIKAKFTPSWETWFRLWECSWSCKARPLHFVGRFCHIVCPPVFVKSMALPVNGTSLFINDATDEVCREVADKLMNTLTQVVLRGILFLHTRGNQGEVLGTQSASRACPQAHQLVQETPLWVGLLSRVLGLPCVRATGYCRAMAQCALQNYSAQHSARYGSGSWVCNPMS